MSPLWVFLGALNNVISNKRVHGITQMVACSPMCELSYTMGDQIYFILRSEEKWLRNNSISKCC